MIVIILIAVVITVVIFHRSLIDRLVIWRYHWRRRRVWYLRPLPPPPTRSPKYIPTPTYFCHQCQQPTMRVVSKPDASYFTVACPCGHRIKDLYNYQLAYLKIDVVAWANLTMLQTLENKIRIAEGNPVLQILEVQSDKDGYWIGEITKDRMRLIDSTSRQIGRRF